MNEATENLASLIFIRHINLSHPLLFPEVANKSVDAAIILRKCIDERKKEMGPVLTPKHKLAWEALMKGKKIDAIRELRAAFGFGLKESKEIIDGWEAKRKEDISWRP